MLESKKPMTFIAKLGLFTMTTIGSYLVLATVFKLYCLCLGHNFTEAIFGGYFSCVLALAAGAELATFYNEQVEHRF